MTFNAQPALQGRHAAWLIATTIGERVGRLYRCLSDTIVRARRGAADRCELERLDNPALHDSGIARAEMLDLVERTRVRLQAQMLGGGQ